MVISENAHGRGRVGQKVLGDLQPKYLEVFESGEPRIITPFKVPRPELFRRFINRESPRPNDS